MADQINPRKDGTSGRRPPGFCQHLKIDTTYVRDSYTYWTGTQFDTIINWVDANASGAYGQSPTGSPTNPNDHGWSNLFGDFMSTSTYQNLCLQAFLKQSQQIPPKVSLINFLVELKDFRGLAKGLSKVPKHVRDGSLAREVNAPIARKGIRRLPKKLAKSGVDSFLSWNFQWAPFIGDLQTLSKIGESTANRLNYLRQIKGKEVTVRYDRKDCYVHPQLGQSLLSFGFGGSQHHYMLRDYQCDFVSTWRLLQNLQELQDAWSGFKATCAALGLNNPVKAAWNAIPFSFMLDWIAPVGDWLEKAAVQPFTGQWDIYDVTSSVHEVAVIDLYSDITLAGQHTHDLMHTVVVDRYTRLPGLPFTLGAVDFSQLTDTQKQLAFAIPLSKVLAK